MKDYRHIAVVGNHMVPFGYTVIDGTDRQGDITYALQGGVSLVDATRGPFRLEECMIAIAKREKARYEAMVAELEAKVRGIDLSSSLINYDYFIDAYGITEDGVENLVVGIRKNAPDLILTNQIIKDHLEAYFNAPRDTPTP